MEMKHDELRDGLRLYAERETQRVKEEAEAALTPRNQLKQALDSLICASIKRDLPDAAERVVEAMEKLFDQPPVAFKKLNIVIDPKQAPYYCRSFGLDVAGHLNVLIAPENKFLFKKIATLLPRPDPDVRALLDAIERKFPDLTRKDAAIIAEPNMWRMIDHYKRVRAKYE